MEVIRLVNLLRNILYVGRCVFLKINYYLGIKKNYDKYFFIRGKLNFFNLLLNIFLEILFCIL